MQVVIRQNQEIKLFNEYDISSNPIIRSNQDAIINSIKFGNLETLKRIIDRNIVNLPLNEDNDTALLHAVKSEQREIAEFLIKSGADPLLKNKLWESPLKIEAARLFEQCAIGAVTTTTQKPITKELTPCVKVYAKELMARRNGYPANPLRMIAGYIGLERLTPEYLLGTMKQEGMGLNQDRIGAINLFRKGMEAGDPYSSFSFYYNRVNINPNPSSDDLYNLALMYAEGQGVQQKYDLAKEFFIKAARKDSEKLIPIGKRFLYGDGVKQDFKLAEECFDLVHSNEKLIEVAETYKKFAQWDKSNIYQKNWALTRASEEYALVTSCRLSKDLEERVRDKIQEVKRMRTELLDPSIKKKEIPELD